MTLIDREADRAAAKLADWEVRIGNLERRASAGGRGFGMSFSGPYPATLGLHSATGVVPSVRSSYTISVVRLIAEPPVVGSTQVRIEANGVAVHTITLASGDDEQADTGSLGTVPAGASVKLRWLARGTGGSRYLVHVEGS